MMFDLRFSFTASLWRWQSDKASWYFVTLPVEDGQHIHFAKGKGAGFGSVRVLAQIGDTSWKTSIFPDKKSGSYILPVKAAVRNTEDLTPDTPIQIMISVID